MAEQCGAFTLLPCLDSADMATSCRMELDISRNIAAKPGLSALEIVKNGFYFSASGKKVEIDSLIKSACSARRSIPPDEQLIDCGSVLFSETRIQVANETTLGASLRLVKGGLRPLALNFASGVQPGGWFLDGAKAQEEVLCRSSALYQTLVNDQMYEEHRKRQQPDSTDWAIYSPDVPVFRNDGGSKLKEPWLLSFITCAAPYAPIIGQPKSGDLLERRIHRVLSIAKSFGYSTLVLGAWGCGAFFNDPHRTAVDFRKAIEGDFRGAFADIVFAITDWSGDRKFLGPFRDVFESDILF